VSGSDISLTPGPGSVTGGEQSVEHPATEAHEGENAKGGASANEAMEVEAHGSMTKDDKHV